MALFHAPSAVTRSSTNRLSAGPKRYLTSFQTKKIPRERAFSGYYHTLVDRIRMAWVDGHTLMEAFAQKSYQHSGDIGFTWGETMESFRDSLMTERNQV